MSKWSIFLVYGTFSVQTLNHVKSMSVVTVQIKLLGNIYAMQVCSGLQNMGFINITIFIKVVYAG